MTDPAARAPESAYRHRFDPARLLLGLCLLLLAVLYAARALGEVRLPWWLLLSGLPAALLAAALLAVVTHTLRRRGAAEAADPRSS